MYYAKLVRKETLEKTKKTKRKKIKRKPYHHPPRRMYFDDTISLSLPLSLS